VTRTPLSRSKRQRSRSPGRFTHRVRQLQQWAWERIGRGKLLLRCGVLGGARRFGAHTGRRGAGAYRGGRPPTAVFCVFPITCSVYCQVSETTKQIEYLTTKCLQQSEKLGVLVFIGHVAYFLGHLNCLLCWQNNNHFISSFSTEVQESIIWPFPGKSVLASCPLIAPCRLSPPPPPSFLAGPVQAPGL